MKTLQKPVLAATLVYLLSTGVNVMAQGAEWQPVTGEHDLRMFMSDTTLEWEEPDASKSSGEYRADGTGTLHAWGATIPRTWEIKGDDQICVTDPQITVCWQLEKNTADPALYRSRQVDTGRMTEIRMSEDGATATAKGDPKPVGNEGGAAAASADEMAAQLSNPNSPVAQLTFKGKFTQFEGALPDADNQSSFTLLFNPTLPFVLGSGAKIFWRPAVPILIDQPVFNPSAGKFDQQSGVGDIGFDLAYSPKIAREDILFAYGLLTTLPTGTAGNLTSGQWSIGPEILIGKVSPKGLFGFFPKHVWDVVGWTDTSINVTRLQPLLTYLPGGGWNFGSTPDITYNWNTEQWTVPVHFIAGKTVMINGRPWKFAVELNYFVEKSDAFSPEWAVNFNASPVVKNMLAGWFGLGGD